MSVVSPTHSSLIERAIGELTAAEAAGDVSLASRIELCQQSIESVAESAGDWLDQAATAKGIHNTPFVVEDLLTGPVVVARQLRFSIQTLSAINSGAAPELPGQVVVLPNGQVAVPVFPTKGFFDSLLFMGLKANVRMQPGVAASEIHGDRPTLARQTKFDRVTTILGAGNVSSIPASDSLNKMLFEGQRVLLKMNPVNEYLAPIFERALAPFVKANLLRIITGGPEVGAAAIHHDRVSAVHVTGSKETHDAIVWGAVGERANRRANNDPVLKKPVTSELGNATPWIMVPGQYSAKQLTSQAAHVAASITNNASFNCLATKLIITWDQWPQREEFLRLVRRHLSNTPTRRAYYPGATERFAKYAGHDAASEDGNLPWTLLEGQSIDERPELFEQESFVCVCAETTLSAAIPVDFLATATEFVNERVFGTLSASVTFPPNFRSRHAREANAAVQNLRYGSVCINQWSGLAYGMTSPPWGAYPGSTLQAVNSGIGNVHNTYLLDKVEKTVVEGPLVDFSKPIWFTTHRNSATVAWRLLDLYHRPSIFRLPKLFAAALTG